MIRGYWYRVPLRRRWLLLGASTEEVAGYRQPAIAIFSVRKMDVLEHPGAVDWSQAHTTMRFARLPLLGLPRGMWWKSQRWGGVGSATRNSGILRGSQFLGILAYLRTSKVSVWGVQYWQSSGDEGADSMMMLLLMMTMMRTTVVEMHCNKL